MTKEQNKIQELAERYSATALINSLLREWDDFEIVNNEVVFKDSFKTLSIVLENYSSVGCHAYKNVYYRTISGAKQSISFTAFVGDLIEIIDKKNAVSMFYTRIMESNQNLTNILDFRKLGYENLYTHTNLSFIEAEQVLILGHNFHPCPKSKVQFKSQDHLSYAPEFGGAFALSWALLDKEYFFQTDSPFFTDRDWHKDLYVKDHETRLDSQYMLFPFHPWQIKVLKKNKEIQSLINNKVLVPIEKTGLLKWQATSSLRTIYCESSEYMLKFSLSLRITNSVRHLQPAEVIRGLQVHEVINSTLGKQFLAENPSFHILNEPSFLAIKGQSTSILPETIVLIRENPFRERNGEKETIVLSAIIQINPYTGNGFFSARNIDTEKWFSLYLGHVLDPFIMAQANYGLLFGAHQQNVVVELSDNYPCGVIFRDCQGTGYTRLGYQKMSAEVSSLDLQNGNVLDDPKAHSLLGYYLIVNSTFSLINALAIQRTCTERELLQMLVSYLSVKRKCGLLDSSFIDYLLNSSLIMQKRNFFCCLRGINENTEGNPLDIYNAISNPLYKINQDFCNA